MPTKLIYFPMLLSLSMKFESIRMSGVMLMVVCHGGYDWWWCLGHGRAAKFCVGCQSN